MAHIKEILVDSFFHCKNKQSASTSDMNVFRRFVIRNAFAKSDANAFTVGRA